MIRSKFLSLTTAGLLAVCLLVAVTLARADWVSQPVDPAPAGYATKTACNDALKLSPAPVSATCVERIRKVVQPLAPLSAAAPACLTPTTDPVAGSKVDLRRIKRDDPLVWGGVRCESLFSTVALKPGSDYWWAFAVNMKPDEAIVPNTADDAMLVMQTHTPAMGATQPDVALFWRGQDKSMFWRIAWNTNPSNTWQYVGGPNPDTQGTWKAPLQPMPAAGVWTRFVVHYRPGFTTAHNPLVEIWSAGPGADYAKLVNYTGFNTYNSLSGPSYPRIGPYKWTSSAWNTNSLAFYTSPLYFGEGANLYDAAKASLAAIR